MRADDEAHDEAEDKVQRRAHRHAGAHHVGPLHVRDVRRHAGDEAGHGELCRCWRRKRSVRYVYGLAQVRGEARGGLGSEAARERAEAERDNGHDDHEYAVAHDDADIRSLEAVVDDDGGDEGHQYLQKHLAAGEAHGDKGVLPVLTRLLSTIFKRLSLQNAMNFSVREIGEHLLLQAHKRPELLGREAAVELLRDGPERRVHHVAGPPALVGGEEQLAPLVEPVGFDAHIALLAQPLYYARGRGQGEIQLAVYVRGRDALRRVRHYKEQHAGLYFGEPLLREGAVAPGLQLDADAPAVPHHFAEVNVHVCASFS